MFKITGTLKKINNEKVISEKYYSEYSRLLYLEKCLQMVTAELCYKPDI